MTTSKLHVAMLPWLAVGHITPYVHVANKLAESGHTVSFFIPTKTQNKFNHLNLHPHLFHFIPFTMESDSLHGGGETMADVDSDQAVSIEKAFDLAQDQVQIALRNLKPDFIFYDFAHWIPNLARPLGIKPIFFSASGAVSYVLLPPSMMGEKAELVERPEVYPGSSLVKPTPSQIIFQELAQAEVDGKMSVFQRVCNSIRGSEALCFRACTETEGPFLDYLEKVYNKPVLTLGPALTQPSNTQLEKKWDEWLGGFEKGSVVYCAFGSECILEKDQFQELILGLESTGYPFLARLKPPPGCETVEEALPEGFEERVRGRGVVHGGWVQQQLILSHSSVGCFISHCGFGSMWEALLSPCQLVCVPLCADQFLNSSFVAKRLKVAVEVERREDEWFSKESVCKAVKLVMDKGSEDGADIRNNHDKLYGFLSDEGLRTSYLSNFITKLENLRK